MSVDAIFNWGSAIGRERALPGRISTVGNFVNSATDRIGRRPTDRSFTISADNVFWTSANARHRPRQDGNSYRIATGLIGVIFADNFVSSILGITIGGLYGATGAQVASQQTIAVSDIIIIATSGVFRSPTATRAIAPRDGWRIGIIDSQISDWGWARGITYYHRRIAGGARDLAGFGA